MTTHPLCASTLANGQRRAIICDLDGTLALLNGRGPYQWHRIAHDLPNPPVVDLLRRYNQDHCILIVTGRSIVTYEATFAWLQAHDIPFCDLFMRQLEDHRKDAAVKYDLYTEQIAGKYAVTLCLDDRNQSVAYWRRMGFPCWQVAPGDF